MSIWVLLLRGVGGPVQVPPRLLRATLAAEGFDRVATYGHTGNAVLASDLPHAQVLAKATEACLREIGFGKGLQVVAGAAWADLVDRNPFPDAALRPSTLHAAILGADPDPARVDAIRALGNGEDGLEVTGRVAYIHTPQGFSRSRIAARFDRGIGVPVTARNWNTVTRLLALAQVAEQS